MNSAQLSVRLDKDALEKARADAQKKGVSLAAHVRDLLVASPGELLANASGGKFTAAYCGYCLATADELLDSPEWRTTEIADWLGEVDRVLGWCRYNPYAQQAPEKVLALFGAVPDAILQAMRAEVLK